MVTLLWLQKMAAAHQHFALQGMLEGTTPSYMAGVMDTKDPQEDLTPHESEHSFLGVDEEEVPLDDVCDEGTLSLVTLCIRIGVSVDNYPSSHHSHSWQKMAICVTWKILQPPFKNLAFPLPFDNSYSSSVTLIEKLHPPLSPISHNFTAVYMFTAQRSWRSLHWVIFVVLEGCTKSRFAQHCLGMSIPTMTPYLSSWMTPFLAWKVWLLHVSNYFSHSITIALITVCYITVGTFARCGLGSAKQRHWVVWFWVRVLSPKGT